MEKSVKINKEERIILLIEIIREIAKCKKLGDDKSEKLLNEIYDKLLKADVIEME